MFSTFYKLHTICGILFVIISQSYATGAINFYQIGESLNGDVNTWDYAGTDISISGDGTRVAVGMPTNDNAGNDAGLVRVYEYNSGIWSQLGGDITGLTAGDQAGVAVSLSNNGMRLAVGSWLYNQQSGNVRVFELDINLSWVLFGSTIEGVQTGSQSGWAVSLSGDGETLAIGAPLYTADGIKSRGYARVYRYFVQSGWSQLVEFSGQSPVEMQVEV